MSNLNVMSFNIRNSCDKGTEAWTARFVNFVPLVKNADPDLIGFQEVLHNQYLDLIENFPEYNSVGIGREDGVNKGERSAIFYKKDRFDLLETNHFWLSETPQTPSFGWDAACIRICTYAKLHDKLTDKVFIHFNVHLDHAGKLAMLEGAKLVRERMLNEHLPAFITGDFNVDENSPAYNVMTDIGLCDSKYAAKSTMKYGTFHGYNPSDNLCDESPIDFLFFTKDDFCVESYKVLVNGKKGEFTSDHYPILVNLMQKN